jgi:hypothetical protein
VEHLIGALDRLRATFRYKADDLDAAGLSVRVGASSLARGRLDQPAAIADDSGTHASLRRLLCDLVEEYGRHTGHADLLREAVDGRVGEDPPAGWRPVSGTGRGDGWSPSGPPG